MKIAILETGRPPGDLGDRFGGYDAMVRRLLGEGHDYVTVPVCDGAALPDPSAFDAYVVTGSSAGVGDDLPWIAPLTAFLREAAAARARLVGLCFGHQVMAQAFGGTVRRAEAGWGLGLHDYAMADPPAWAEPVGTVAVPASHQDQVVVKPPGARVVASSAFTPFAILAYDDRPAISFQCHPEFDPAFAAELVRRNDGLGPADKDAALASLDRPNDTARLGCWINRFLAGPQAGTLTPP